MGDDKGETIEGFYTEGVEEDIETGGADKQVVGTTNVVSFTHNDSSDANNGPRPTTWNTAPNALVCVGVLMCVSVCLRLLHSEIGISHRVQTLLTTGVGGGALSDFVTSVGPSFLKTFGAAKGKTMSLLGVRGRSKSRTAAFVCHLARSADLPLFFAALLTFTCSCRLDRQQLQERLGTTAPSPENNHGCIIKTD